MTIKQLEDRIVAKDWDIVENIKTLGAEAIPTLKKFLENDDGEIRELSLMCMAEIGGEDVRAIYLERLQDKDINVRRTAIGLLEENYSLNILPQLINDLQLNQDEFVRAKIALLIGRIGERGIIPQLKDAQSKESDESVKENISLGLARLGEFAEQQKVLKKLESASTNSRHEALLNLEYINNKEYIYKISLLLDDKSGVLNTAPEPFKNIIRVCDVAVKVIAVICNQPFSFAADELRNYSDTEINEVRQYVTSFDR